MASIDKLGSLLLLPLASPVVLFTIVIVVVVVVVAAAAAAAAAAIATKEQAFSTPTCRPILGP
jgi:flagellar basal body-associated protein FliL